MGIPKETMTMEQMVADTIAVTEYLCQRFGKSKIYLMGHSWGSFLGTLAAQQAPHLYHAYIGIGQVTRQLESEKLAYTYMLREFRANGNKKLLNKLEKFAIDKGGEVNNKYLVVRSKGMLKLGIGVMRKSTSMKDILMQVLRFRGYTLKEKLNFFIGMGFSQNYLWNAVIGSDLIKLVSRLEVPLYVLHGRYDYQVSYTLAKEFVQAIQAPIKGFYTFDNSAHSPCFEEPDKMCEILKRDVMQHKTSLADLSATGIDK